MIKLSQYERYVGLAVS